MKSTIYNLIKKNGHSIFNRVFNFTIIVLIVLSLVEIILESFEDFRIKHQLWLNIFEDITVVVFTIEYLLRLYTADLQYKDYTPFRARVKFVLSGEGLVDLLAILPFYLPLLGFDFRFLRTLRLVRLLRIFKINRYTNSLKILKSVFQEKLPDIGVAFFLMIIFLLITSVLMYYVEKDAQPEEFPNIVASFWWSIITLTTVGYGDVVPITAVGKLLAGMISVISVGIIAIPTGIVSSGFIGKMEESKTHKSQICPHCGKEVH